MNDLLHALVPLLGMGVILAPVVFALVHAHNTRRDFIDSFIDDPDCRASLVGNSGMVRVSTTGERWRTSLVCHVPGGKETTWTLRARPPSFASRTTVSLRREDFTGYLREHLFKKHDVHVGDATFDDALQIGGSDPAVVRGVFAKADVRGAVLRAFRDLHIATISIDAHAATVLLYKSSTKPEDVKRVVLRIADLFEALDNESNVAALMPPSSGAVVEGPAASSESGAPVAVPIDLGARR